MANPYQPLIFGYLKKYQEDPQSRVFAPLAEAYRKSGMVDEALEIAQEGLKHHPHFVGGRVALARALFDKKRFEEVVSELAQIVRDVPDNIVAQRLMAESSLILGRSNEALNAYKMILFFHPEDPETARLVQELEVQAYEQGALQLRRDPEPTPVLGFVESDARGAIAGDPERKRAAEKATAIRRIERLQGMLQSVERYRARSRASR